MLSQSYRLAGSRIPDLLKQGRRVHSEIASLIFLQNDSSKNPHIGVIVSVKLSKKAVYRNRTKRLIYEVIRQNIEAIKPGLDIIVMAKKLLLEEKLSSVQQPILELLQKANILLR